MTFPAGGDRVGGRHRPPPSSPSWPGPDAWFEPDAPTPPTGMRRVEAWPGHRPPPIRLPRAPGPAGPPQPAGRPGRPVPRPVRVAFRWWLVAVALGVVAVALSVALAVMYAQRYGNAPAGGATVGSVLSEVLALGAAAFVIIRMRAGDDWARTVLTVVGGLVGLLVAITAIVRFSADSSMMAAFRSITSMVRLLQVSAVAAAIWSMFQPGIGHYFDPRKRDD